MQYIWLLLFSVGGIVTDSCSGSLQHQSSIQVFSLSLCRPQWGKFTRRWQLWVCADQAQPVSVHPFLIRSLKQQGVLEVSCIDHTCAEQEPDQSFTMSLIHSRAAVRIYYLKWTAGLMAMKCHPFPFVNLTVQLITEFCDLLKQIAK